MSESFGPVRFEGIHCTIETKRPARGLVVVSLSGTDAGELGDAVRSRS